MKNKKYIYPIGIVVMTFVIISLGATYAYFFASVEGSGNSKNNTTNVTAVSLGTVKYDGELTFQGQKLYPGYQNIQTFTIEKDHQEGIGTYEIDLEAIVPEEFGSDIKITLYKTTDPEKNKITRTEGNLVMEENQYIKEDVINITGNPIIVYQGELKENKQILLEQVSFDTNNFEKTTYYFVYHYQDNGNQDIQQGRTFEGKITVRLIANKIYKETILNGTDPLITGSLIPINIANDGVVSKAEQTKEWYNYEEKRWANAVILKDESVTYNNGEIIPESNIESYFVWIPRYKYKIFNEGVYDAVTNIGNKVQRIEIEFENKDTLISTGSKVGEWLTHPAFTAFNSNGMWVGKYETGTTLTSNYNQKSGESVLIKPNISSWRNIQVGNAFYTSYDYKRELDSHLMKNTEWGAIAYLQHSKYGSEASVRINNNSNFITGYAANQEPTCGYTGTNIACNRYCSDGTCNKPYNTEIGSLASTTANITGVFDMAGGAWEYVMGVLTDQNGNPMSGRNSLYHSGFNGPLGCPSCDNNTSGVTSITSGYDWPDKKYYDTYFYSMSPQQYGRRILGDATGEMGPFASATDLNRTKTFGSWYNDYASFISTNYPWFVRGLAHYFGLEVGIFAFSETYGQANNNVGYRIVLTP